MVESAGSVIVTVNILNGTLARDLHVLLMAALTSLTNGTATGMYIEFLKTIFWFVNVKFTESNFSYMQLQWTTQSQVVTWHLMPPHHLKQ